jgi:hypothetical protein
LKKEEKTRVITTEQLRAVDKKKTGISHTTSKCGFFCVIGRFTSGKKILGFFLLPLSIFFIFVFKKILYCEIHG